MKDEYFFFNGIDIEGLAEFLYIKKDEYHVELLDNGLFSVTYEGIEIFPFSLLYYNSKIDMYDFFILDS